MDSRLKVPVRYPGRANKKNNNIASQRNFTSHCSLADSEVNDEFGN